MDPLQAIVDLLIDFEVVRFGEFKLKSGRTSPYFVNAGQLRTGKAMLRLGDAFASMIRAHALPCDLVFGPAYKGVPLSVATAMALSRGEQDVGFCFDRKEAKDHGEGGMFVGTTPQNGMNVIVVDDVITSGLSIRTAVHQIRSAARVHVAGVIVAVDRQEKGVSGTRSTLSELREELAVDVHPLISIRELVKRLHDDPRSAHLGLDSTRISAIDRYLETHGGKD